MWPPSSEDTLFGAHNDRNRVPAHDRVRAALDRRVVRARWLALKGERVDVRGVWAGDRSGAGVLRAFDDLSQRVSGSVRPVVGNYAVERRGRFTRPDRSMSAPPTVRR